MPTTAPSPEKAAPPAEKVEFPTHVSPIGIYFGVVSTLVILFAVATLLTTRLPIVVMPLLLLVAGCCAVLAKATIDEMGTVTIEWSSHGVTVHRLLGSVNYAWSHVERVELCDPGATFGDNGRHEEKRSAIGLFIRNPAKKNRQPGDLPDVMLISRVGAAADRIPKLCERLSNSRRYGGGKDSRKIGAVAAPPSKGRSAKQFRRSSAA